MCFFALTCLASGALAAPGRVMLTPSMQTKALSSNPHVSPRLQQVRESTSNIAGLHDSRSHPRGFSMSKGRPSATLALDRPVALKSLPHPAYAVSESSLTAKRKFWVGGNWKCNGNGDSVAKLLDGLNIAKRITSDPEVEVVCAPPVVYLDKAKNQLKGNIQLAAQNLWAGEQGAYTGEHTADMLKDMGVEWAIVGHSERRHRPELKETDDVVARKALQAIKSGIKVVVCVGETLEEREEGKTLAVITRQLLALATRCPPKSFNDIVIAYEPVWAIGTGKTATVEQAQEVHEYIRKWVRNAVGQEIADKIRIVYGGSVNPENANALSKMPDVDGFLVGGASLNAASFMKIVAHDKNVKEIKRRTRNGLVTSARVTHPVAWSALGRYLGATSVQFGILAGFLFGLDALFSYFQKDVPVKFVAALFAFLSLRSRMFSIMDNSRPKASKTDPVFERKKPWWTPPPLTFPIVWSIVAVLRSLSTTVAFVAAGEKLFSAPLLAMVAHLCIGDTWNTINNVERRMGTAVLGVLGVLGSAVAVTSLYYNTIPLAGMILAPSVLWLSIASLLITQIWRLNNNGGSEPLLPARGVPPAKFKIPFTSLTK